MNQNSIPVDNIDVVHKDISRDSFNRMIRNTWGTPEQTVRSAAIYPRKVKSVVICAKIYPPALTDVCQENRHLSPLIFYTALSASDDDAGNHGSAHLFSGAPQVNRGRLFQDHEVLFCRNRPGISRGKYRVCSLVQSISLTLYRNTNFHT